METEGSRNNLGELYREYLREREEAEVLVVDGCFAVFAIKGTRIFFKELYASAEMRAKGVAKKLCYHLLEIAKEAGCTHARCTIDLRAHGSQHAFEVFYAHGLRPCRAENSVITLEMEI